MYNALTRPRNLTTRYETATFENICWPIAGPRGEVSLSLNVSQQEYARLFETDGPRLEFRHTYLSQEVASKTLRYKGSRDIALRLDLSYRFDPGQAPQQRLRANHSRPRSRASDGRKDAVYFFPQGHHTDCTQAMFGQY